MARRRAGADRSTKGAATGAHAKAPEVDPRVSARRAQVARSRRWRWWIGLGSLAAIFVLAVGAWLLLHTSFFQAKTLRVEGSAHEPAGLIVAASGITTQTPLISIDTASAATGIEALPWVKTASVELHWPSTVVIAVTQRTPVAVMHAPNRHALIDPTGRVLARPHTLPSGAPTVHLVVPGVVPGIPGSGHLAASVLRPGQSGDRQSRRHGNAPDGRTGDILSRSADPSHGQVQGRCSDHRRDHAARWRRGGCFGAAGLDHHGAVTSLSLDLPTRSRVLGTIRDVSAT